MPNGGKILSWNGNQHCNKNIMISNGMKIIAHMDEQH